MAKKIVTLYIRDNSINLLVMRVNRLDRWGSSPLEAGLVSQGVVQDEDKVADRVRELFKVEKLSTGKVVVGLSGVNSLYRLITLPEVPGAVLSQAIRHEARRVIPVSLEDVYLSYQPIPSPKGETRIFLAAFPRNIADSLVHTLKKAGLQPEIMDLAPLALARIPNEPRAIIINSRLDHLTIIVIEDRLPQLIRRLSLPSENQSLAQRLPTITEELIRTATFYNSSHLEKPLDAKVPAFVCGDLAKAPETWPQLVGNFNFPVSTLPLPMEAPEDFPGDEFMVNVGLALKQQGQDRGEGNYSLVNLNTLPESYRPKGISVSRIAVPVGIVVGVGLIGYMGLMTRGAMTKTADLQSQLPAIQSSITQEQKQNSQIKDQVKQAQAQLDPLKAQINQVGNLVTVFKSVTTGLTDQRALIDTKLQNSFNLKPQGVVLNGLNNTGGTLTLQGNSPSSTSIFDYAKALRTGGVGKTLTLTSISMAVQDDGTKLYTFSILLK